MRLNSKALTTATVGVIWLVVVLTIWAELSAPFKAYLAQLTGHHWTTKGVIAIAAFFLLYLICNRMKESHNVAQGAWYAAGSVVLGGLTIFLFYLWHFLNG